MLCCDELPEDQPQSGFLKPEALTQVRSMDTEDLSEHKKTEHMSTGVFVDAAFLTGGKPILDSAAEIEQPHIKYEFINAWLMAQCTSSRRRVLSDVTTKLGRNSSSSWSRRNTSN